MLVYLTRCTCLTHVTENYVWSTTLLINLVLYWHAEDKCRRLTVLKRWQSIRMKSHVIIGRLTSDVAEAAIVNNGTQCDTLHSQRQQC